MILGQVVKKLEGGRHKQHGEVFCIFNDTRPIWHWIIDINE
jgi:hypothetical protein